MQRLKIIFNEVDTKDLCMVIYSSTSNKGLLYCSFGVFELPNHSNHAWYLDRLYDLLVLCFNKRDFMGTYCLGRGSP
jgi:hypothetical protein